MPIWGLYIDETLDVLEHVHDPADPVDSKDISRSVESLPLVDYFGSAPSNAPEHSACIKQRKHCHV